MRTLTCDPCGAVLQAAASLLAPVSSAPPAEIPSAGPTLVLFVRHFG
jgi:hypothetical protein